MRDAGSPNAQEPTKKKKEMQGKKNNPRMNIQRKEIRVREKKATILKKKKNCSISKSILGEMYIKLFGYRAVAQMRSIASARAVSVVEYASLLRRVAIHVSLSLACLYEKYE